MKTLTSLALACTLASAQTPTRYRIDTVAGNAAVPDGIAATSATLGQPLAVIPDSSGGFFFSDLGRFRIRHVSAAGVIRTVAGTGVSGVNDDGAPALESQINDVASLALAANGDLYFAETFSCRVSRLDAAGILRHVAGNGSCGFSGDRGPALAAQLNGPRRVALDAQGRLLIADTLNSRIRRVGLDGNIETIAGTGNSQTFSREDGTQAIQTPISFPIGLAPAADGTLYFAESGYRRVRRIAPDGRVSTVAGDGLDGNTGDGGPAVQARFRQPWSIALDPPRNRLLIADGLANRIRRVDLPSGTIAHAAGITFASGIAFSNSFSGDNGPPGNAGLANPSYVSVDASGALYIADQENRRIRRADTMIRTVAGRFRTSGDGPALAAELADVNALAFTPAGELLLSDAGNRLLRKVTNSSITTLAGIPEERLPANTAPVSSGDGGAAAAAGFSTLNSIAVDATGRILINDNGRLRRIDGSSILSVGAGAAANLPTGASHFAFDTARNRLYLAAPSANKILVADLTQANLVFRDFAGTGTAGFAGDGGPAQAAQLHGPADVAVDTAGNVYIADRNRLRRVSPEGVISTVAGTGAGLTTEAGLEETPALSTPIAPASVATDPAGRVTFAEGARSRALRQFDPATNRIRAIAGSSVRGLSGDGGLALGARISTPGFVRTNSAGHIYFIELIDDVVRVLRPVVLSRFEAVSGDRQTEAAGTKLAAPLVVRVATADGPIAGVTVAFTANAGATVAPAAAVTGADGLARAEVILGPAAGPVTITAAVDGLTPVTFQATATAAGVTNPNRPAIRAGGVATAGAFGGLATISPGTWIEIFGTNLATATRPWGGDDFRGAQAPTELDGVRVSVNNQAAFVAFISPNQINAQVPGSIGTGMVPVTVTNANGTSESFLIAAAAASPALLAPPVFAIGGVQYVVALHQDGAFVGREGLIAGANFRPARAGDVLTLYGVGFGATTPAVPPGVVVSGTPALPAVTVRLGEAAANVLFAGLAPSAVGLYQFNIVVPAGVPEGDVALSITGVNQRLVLTLGR